MNAHFKHSSRLLLGTLVVLFGGLLLWGCEESTNPVAPGLDEETAVTAANKGKPPNVGALVVAERSTPNDSQDFYSKDCPGETLSDYTSVFNKDWEGAIPGNCVVMGTLGENFGRVLFGALRGERGMITGFQIIARREEDGVWKHYATRKTYFDQDRPNGFPDGRLEVQMYDVELLYIQGDGKRLKGNPKFLGHAAWINVGDIVYTRQ